MYDMLRRAEQAMRQEVKDTHNTSIPLVQPHYRRSRQHSSGE